MGNKGPNINIRYNVMTVLIYVVGIIFLIRLFSLQIISGAEYRETSNTRLSRETSLKAARGNITDRSGNVLAGTHMGFGLEFYKSKADNKTLNDTILRIITVLDEKGEKYDDTFPISINPFKFTFSSKEEEMAWKQKYDIDANTSAEDCFYVFQEKYKIDNEYIEDIRKIITVRYRIETEGYSSTKSIKLADDIKRDTAVTFRERSSDFPGINVTLSAIREYPNKNLASHIVGYIGKIGEEEYKANKDQGYLISDYVGKTGIEYTFEKYLKGTDGVKQIDMAVDGTVNDEYIVEEAVGGANVALTIDANLQQVAENALEEAVIGLQKGKYNKTKYKSNWGAVVVMDVKNGEILAMASYPDYDPNIFVGVLDDKEWKDVSEGNKLFNNAIQGSSAPGSTFKMVTGIAALETGKVDRYDTVNDVGIYHKAHNPVCWYYTSYKTGHGYLNMEHALEQSCNYFFYEMGDRVGIDTLEKYARYFGLGSKTGVELPSETTGTVASRAEAEKDGEQWSEGSTLSAAIGQSYNNFSPIQMAKYVAMIANGGKKVDPTIVKSIINTDGTEVKKDEIEKYVKKRLNLPDDKTEDLKISKESLDTIRSGMKLVTTSGSGTAYSVFKGFNITVAGKTGSAQAGDVTNGWFVGFAPYKSPEVAVAVLIEDGATGGATGTVARQVIAQYFGMNSTDIQEDITALPTIEMQR